MDWASNEPAHDPGLYFVPEEEGRVSLLEEPRLGGRGAPPFPRLPAGAGPAGRGGLPGGGREGFYGGVVSSRGNQPAVDGVDWDPRPMRFNPRAGPAWARFAPTELQRPHRGGPGPYQAFPMVSQDEAQVGPRDLFAPGPLPPGPDPGPELGGISLPMGLLLLILVALAAQLIALKRDLRDLSLLLACRSAAGERARDLT